MVDEPLQSTTMERIFLRFFCVLNSEWIGILEKTLYAFFISLCQSILALCVWRLACMWDCTCKHANRIKREIIDYSDSVDNMKILSSKRTCMYDGFSIFLCNFFFLLLNSNSKRLYRYAMVILSASFVFHWIIKITRVVPCYLSLC